MPTDYDRIAEQYQMAKKSPWRLHIEHFTMFELLGDLAGKTVLDLACGEGYYSRALKAAGAARVVGVGIRFHAPRLSPTGAQMFAAGFWDDFLADQPVFFIECHS